MAATLLTAGCETPSRDWSREPAPRAFGHRPKELAAIPSKEPVKETAKPPVKAPATATRGPTAAKSDRATDASPQVREAQQLLTALRYDAGPVDGVAGEQTKDAIIAFQRQRNLRASGRVSPTLLSALRQANREAAAAAKATPPSRPAASPPEQRSASPPEQRSASPAGQDAGGLGRLPRQSDVN